MSSFEASSRNAVPCNTNSGLHNHLNVLTIDGTHHHWLLYTSVIWRRLQRLVNQTLTKPPLIGAQMPKWLMLLVFNCLLLAMPSENTYTVPAEPTALLQGACNKQLDCNLPGPVCVVGHAGAWRCSTADLAEWTTFCATCCTLTTPFVHQLPYPECLKSSHFWFNSIWFDMCDVLRGNWNPTGKKNSSVNQESICDVWYTS